MFARNCVQAVIWRRQGCEAAALLQAGCPVWAGCFVPAAGKGMRPRRSCKLAAPLMDGASMTGRQRYEAAALLQDKHAGRLL